MSPLFVALLLSYAFIGVLFMAFMWIADRADARRRRLNHISTIGRDRPALPLAVAIPTAWRKRR